MTSLSKGPEADLSYRTASHRRRRASRALNERRLWRPGFTGIACLTILVMVGMTFIMRQIQIRQMEEYIEGLEQEIQYYTQANDNLRQQIEVLKSEQYIEKIARERLGLVRPGEVPYIITLPDPAPANEDSAVGPGGFTRR